MSSSGLAPLSSRSSQENISAQGRVDGPRVKAGQRVVLGVLTENDHNRTCCQGVPAKSGSALHSVSSHGINTSYQSSSAFGALVAEPAVVHAPRPAGEQSAASLIHPSELHVLSAVNDFSSGSCLDASMQSLSEEELAPFEDVLSVAEYAEDIHKHLRESELRYRPKPGYMRKQPDITNSMRVILVDWLVEVAEEYKLCSETILLAVNYLDRFLSCMSVLRGKLQLVGTAAILVAAKYEEIYPPEVEEFVYITDDTYTKKQLLRMEHLILKVLSFDMTAPTSHQFLMQYLLVEGVCAKTSNLALYLSELSLLEVDPFLQYLPSKIAAAAYCLANYTLNRNLWPDALYTFTGYTLAEIAPCLVAIHNLHLGAESRPQQAIRDKYESTKYCSVSLIKPVGALPLH
ncbi:cyclin-A1 [Pygocentrus nattereri]|uniref:Cyclin N-terminal domain-containing protein n=1 Tax=Pygocentrus nattereri TaxID=42514 RepID=A0A3B4E903_PYGNA|nr:cyclin-A1 [Pygocentrus nattereri]